MAIDNEHVSIMYLNFVGNCSSINLLHVGADFFRILTRINEPPVRPLHGGQIVLECILDLCSRQRDKIICRRRLSSGLAIVSCYNSRQYSCVLWKLVWWRRAVRHCTNLSSSNSIIWIASLRLASVILSVWGSALIMTCRRDRSSAARYPRRILTGMIACQSGCTLPGPFPFKSLSTLSSNNLCEWNYQIRYPDVSYVPLSRLDLALSRRLKWSTRSYTYRELSGVPSLSEGCPTPQKLTDVFLWPRLVDKTLVGMYLPFTFSEK